MGTLRTKAMDLLNEAENPTIFFPALAGKYLPTLLLTCSKNLAGNKAVQNYFHCLQYFLTGQNTGQQQSLLLSPSTSSMAVFYHPSLIKFFSDPLQAPHHQKCFALLPPASSQMQTGAEQKTRKHLCGILALPVAPFEGRSEMSLPTRVIPTGPQIFPGLAREESESSFQRKSSGMAHSLCASSPAKRSHMAALNCTYCAGITRPSGFLLQDCPTVQLPPSCHLPAWQTLSCSLGSSLLQAAPSLGGCTLRALPSSPPRFYRAHPCLH